MRKILITLIVILFVLVSCLEDLDSVRKKSLFAFYDDKRLESVLQWLSREKEQVILLTCHNREERILKNLVRERRVSDEDKFA